MPTHQFIHDRRLVELGLRNYWGYNSIGFFAPHNEYAVGGQDGAQVREFKVMVKTLHEAGIEVILDVVYNHTAEGGAGGPVLSFKGLDNRAYYRLDPEDPSRYVDYTGTGNSLNMRHPHVLQLIMDSLRFWVEEMHVDGFRFDLAATLARELHDVDRLSAFFDLIQQDPVVSQVKLIAEPWDVGEGGYQVGNFPPLWSEWNGRYRDCVRDVWRSSGDHLGEFAARLTGSSDLYEDDGRRPHASINFVTAHDGFTLADLVTYEQKHNLANGEDNRDGTDDNRSWSCALVNSATCWRPCCCPRACRCCSPATRWAGPSRATTTPTHRTTRSRGSTGPRSTRNCSSSRDVSSRCAGRTRCCTVGGSSPGRRSTATSCPTWPGSPPTGRR
jgi:glycogen operon protein